MGQKPRKRPISGNEKKLCCTLGMRIPEPGTYISKGQESPAAILVIFLLRFVSPVKLALGPDSCKICHQSFLGKEQNSSEIGLNKNSEASNQTRTEKKLLGHIIEKSQGIESGRAGSRC